MKVVDEDEQRTALRDVDGEPIQPVDKRKRVVSQRRRIIDLGVEDTFRVCCGLPEEFCALGRLRPRDDALEELTYDAVGKSPLELVAARPEHRHPGGFRTRPARSQQRGLPDSSGPFDYDEGAVAGEAGVERCPDAL